MRRVITYLMAHKGRFILGAVFAGGLGMVPLMVVGGHMMAEVVDSPSFCTQACHNVHYAEAVTFRESPHSQVTCASCHVGSGTENLVRSKLRGLNDIIPSITGNYQRPMPTPLRNRRPSTETCEKCHWSEKFSGDIPRITTSYGADESNSKNTITRVLKVNGGKEEVASGIHWHATARVWYLPMDDQRFNIAWVAKEDASGYVTEYLDPGQIKEITPERFQKKVRLMDCMDCHNRVTHLFRSPDELVDKALADSSIDANLPFIKREALNALVPQNSSLNQAYDKIAKIGEFYRTSYPKISQENRASIDSATSKLREIARLTTFTDNLDWTTYPDHSKHDNPGPDMQIDFDTIAARRESPGCFRCHGTLVRVDDLPAVIGSPSLNGVPEELNPNGASANPATLDGLNISAILEKLNRNGRGAATTGGLNITWPAEAKLSADCASCHYVFQSPNASPLAPATSHPIDRLDNCLACHSPSAARPFKTDHPWSTNKACNSCHQSAPKLQRLPLNQPSVEAKPISHSSNKLENCLSCHNPSGANPVSRDHPWATNDTCAACHQSATKFTPLSSARPAAEAKPVTHSTDKLENCLTCHQPSGVSPISRDHPWATNATCAACHQSAANPKSFPSTRIPGEAKPVAHSTNKLENCLSCHQPSGVSPIPRDHPWATNATCAACHQSATNPKPFPSTGPPAEARTISHSTDKLGNCLSCHGPSAAQPFSRDHAWSTNETCSACHKPAAPPASVKPPIIPLARSIPHSVSGLGSCLSCHNQSGLAPFRADHLGRPDSLCTFCHKPGTTTQPQPQIPQGRQVPHPTSGIGSCRSCHDQSGPKPFPGDHIGRPDSMCSICHKPASAFSPLPPPGIAPTPLPPPGVTPTPPPAMTPAPTPAPPMPTPPPSGGTNTAVLYAANCGMCHGTNRQGGIGPALTTTALAGRSLNQITAAITSGIGTMPGFSSILTPAQISALAQFLKSTPP